MTNFTLKQLRYFEALAREASFRKAAEACAISQPALSMQIKEMEVSEDVFYLSTYTICVILPSLEKVLKT